LAIGDSRLAQNETMRKALTVTIPDDAPFTRSYFERASIQESRYVVSDASQLYRPAAEPALTAVARYRVAGVPVGTRPPGRRGGPRLPYGEELREVMVVPAVAVNVSPRTAIVPAPAPSRSAVAPAGKKTLDIRVELVNNAAAGAGGRLAL